MIKQFFQSIGNIFINLVYLLTRLITHIITSIFYTIINPILSIFRENEFFWIFAILYLLISSPDILTIVFSSIYFSRCDLTYGQKTGLYTIIGFTSLNLLKRIIFMCGGFSNRNFSDYFDCEKIFKIFIYMIIPVVSYSSNLIFYNKLELDMCTQSIPTNRDKLIFILIFGLIGGLAESDNIYNTWDSIVNRNRRRDELRISPTQVNIDNNVTVIVVSNRPNEVLDDYVLPSKMHIIDKINNLNFINNDEINQNISCNICFDTELNDMICIECKHHYHKQCLIKWIKQEINTSKLCPICRTEI